MAKISEPIGRNIKDQILEACKREEYFATVGCSQDIHKKFIEIVHNLMNPKKLCDAENAAGDLMRLELEYHDKVESIGPAQGLMNAFEKSGDYAHFQKHRLHYTHMANVFLLGLYIYHGSAKVRHLIDKHMEDTTNCVTVAGLGEIKYSGGSPLGEFLYRWRLAALTHDLGNGISINQNDTDKILKHLNELLGRTGSPVPSLCELTQFQDPSLYENFKTGLRRAGVDLDTFWQELLEHPIGDDISKIYYDHGVVSALILLKLMDDTFHAPGRQVVEYVNDRAIVYDKKFLEESVLQAAIAVALHNLTQAEGPLEAGIEAVSQDEIDISYEIYNIDTDPFAWLLKIADILQEWDKPLAADEKALNEEPKKTSLNITFEPSLIRVAGLPTDKVKKLNEEIEKYTLPKGILEFT